ncbi:MAG: hypothetical protein WBL63_14425 [Candidatus Acidiferrum sp.]
MSDRTEYQAQIDRLFQGRSLHGSESLCKLLRYLAEHSLNHPGVAPKEYQIATEVFGRPEDFDPHLDSLVRVQAGRLRAKLAEHYASEGAHDPILVELPKGSYTLTFSERSVTAPKVKDHAHRTVDAVAKTDSKLSLTLRWIVALIAFSMVLGAILTVAIARILPYWIAEAHPSGGTREVPGAIRTFWNGFLGGHEQPLVVFSNAPFVGRPDSGMRYYNAARDGKALILDHYTGVGEVLAVHSLDDVFRQLQQELRVKRGSLFSLDDAKNNDLIFLGSPSENLTLLDIPATKEFTFQRMACCSRVGNIEIVNVHPAPGEAREYEASPSNEFLTEDYAVIALVKGLEPTYSVLILAGTTTIGTQAAVEYVCQQSSLEELLGRMGVSSARELRPFEAVIRVKVARGVPVGTELVALHKSAG